MDEIFKNVLYKNSLVLYSNSQFTLLLITNKSLFFFIFLYYYSRIIVIVADFEENYEF